MSGLNFGFGPPPANPALPNTSGGTGGNIVSTLMGILQGIHGANQNSMQSQQQKLQLDQAKRADAQQQLNKLGEIVNSDPSKRFDAKIIAQAKQLSAAAGLPNPVTGPTPTTEANPDSSPTAGPTGPSTKFKDGVTAPGITQQQKQLDTVPTLAKESLDMSVVSPKPDFNNISPDLQKYGLSLTGEARRSFFSKYSNVPQGMAEADPVIPYQEHVAAQKNLMDVVTKLGSGAVTPNEARVLIGSLQGDLSTGAIKQADVDQMLTNPQVVAPMVQAKIDSLKFLNLDKASEAAYRQMLTKELPLKIQAQISQGQQNADSRSQMVSISGQRLAAQTDRWLHQDSTDLQRANSAAQASQAAVTSANVRAATAAQIPLSNAVKGLQASYNTAAGVVKSLIANNQDPTNGVARPDNPKAMNDPSLDPDGYYQTPAGIAEKLRSQLDPLLAAQQSAAGFLKGGPARAVQNASGNSSVKSTNDTTYAAGTPVPGHPDYKFTGEKKNGKYVVVGPDGTQQGFVP